MAVDGLRFSVSCTSVSAHVFAIVQSTYVMLNMLSVLASLVSHASQERHANSDCYRLLARYNKTALDSFAASRTLQLSALETEHPDLETETCSCQPW